MFFNKKHSNVSFFLYFVRNGVRSLRYVIIEGILGNWLKETFLTFLSSLFCRKRSRKLQVYHNRGNIGEIKETFLTFLSSLFCRKRSGKLWVCYNRGNIGEIDLKKRFWHFFLFYFVGNEVEDLGYVIIEGILEKLT